MLRHRTVAVVQSRMASTRLPGKALVDLGGRPAIEQMVRRLRAVREIDEVVVATTISPNDDVLVDYLDSIGTASFRGSESDVLERLAQAVTDLDCDYVVKVTADCPALDPKIATEVVRVAHTGRYDFVSNGMVRSYPDGMDCAVVKRSALLRSAAEAVEPLEREHTSLYIRQHPDEYPQHNVHAPDDQFWPELGLTLDTPEDLALLSRIFAELGPDRLFSCAEMIALLRARPDLAAINAHVARKGDT